MASSAIDETTAIGKRAAERLRSESIAWLTTVGNDGTPQPNPVWFLWDGADGVVVYNATKANRVNHVKARPQVSLHFDSHDGGDIVVIRGAAAEAADLPSSDQNAEFQAKYGASIKGGPWKTPEQFDRDYPHKLRITIQGVRGF